MPQKPDHLTGERHGILVPKFRNDGCATRLLAITSRRILVRMLRTKEPGSMGENRAEQFGSVLEPASRFATVTAFTCV